MKSIRSHTDSIIFIFGGRVLKLPLTFGALRELRLGEAGRIAAKNDPFFSRFVLPERLAGFVRFSHFASPLKKNPQHESLVASYFQDAFSQAGAWPRVPLAKSFGSQCFLNFIAGRFLSSAKFWHDYLAEGTIAESSCHGDFHQENILILKGQLKFTDWPLYDAHGSRYFDLINYYIFSAKGADSWIKYWQKIISDPPKKIIEVSIPNEYWFFYAIWKIGAEAAILKIRGKFSAEKIDKYASFVPKLTAILQTKYD